MVNLPGASTQPNASPVPRPVSMTMTQPDASPVPVPVRVMLTMPSSSDEPHSVLLEPAPLTILVLYWSQQNPLMIIICHAVSNLSKDEKLFYEHIPIQLFQVHSCINNRKLVILGWKNIFGFYIFQS